MLANKGSGASTPMESLSGLGGDVKQAFSQCPPVKSHVRNQTTDLLIAADSVTNAMSSLVKELNSGMMQNLYAAQLKSNRVYSI